MRTVSVKILIIFLVTINLAFTQFEQNQINKETSTTLISVTIGGSFIVTGSFSANMNERVDQYVTRIFTSAKKDVLSRLTERDLMVKLEKKINEYALRDILLKRSNGEQLTIDLAKFRVNGDFKNNPYLRNDDVLIFPPTDLEINYFTIDGAINKPGKYQFVPGDKLLDAIELAQGINYAYQKPIEVEITRLSYNGEELKSFKIDINDNINLEVGDRLKVLSNETQKRDFKVYLLGEVKNPGYLPISKSQTNLKEVIEKAGGFNSRANKEYVKIFKNSGLPPEFYKLKYNINVQKDFSEKEWLVYSQLLDLEKRNLTRMSNLTEEDTAYFSLESNLKFWLDGATVNCGNLYEQNSEASNYILEDGDVIIVPPLSKKISVFGQVKKPGNYDYNEGKDVQFYLERCGGLGEYANKSIIIIKHNSNEWIEVEGNYHQIEPDDIIWVSREANHSFNYYVELFGKYLNIVGSLATITLLLVQFSK
jgi:protein involved in polysaccharide export with SLBB domain